MPWWNCVQCLIPVRIPPNITTLNYNHGQLTEVPSEIFAYERTLEELFLESNHITALPRQLFHCHGLKKLDLSDNEITSMPSAVSSLVNLRCLDLSRNAISTLPDTMKNCTNLVCLNLSLNPLDRICDSLTNIFSLHELYLTDVYIDFLPANFGRLINLKILELRDNNLVTLPKSMNRLINLTRLDIGQNQFTELPEVVSGLFNLNELWIDLNRIQRLPSSIGQLRKLIHFDANSNCLQALPRHIGYWTKIVELCVTNNKLHELPSTIGNMKSLRGLKLDMNRLQMLPDSIGKLNNLEELDVSYNDLVVLPGTIGLLRNLRSLTIDKNLLSDLPIEIGSCINLRVLSLQGNRLRYLPAEMGHLLHLHVLNLKSNQLQELPVSFLKLVNLAALWLSNNQSQPLVPLQKDYNRESGHMYLTCFMLPQMSNETVQENNNQNSNEYVHLNVHQNTSRQKHICFAADAGPADEPQRLSRAPTPYPKDLRELARHVRLMQRGLHLGSSPVQKTRDDEAIQGPSGVTRNNEPNKSDKQPHLEIENYNEPIYVSKTSKNEPKIREAKFIRTYAKSSETELKPSLKINDTQTTSNSEIWDNNGPSTITILAPPPPPPSPGRNPPQKPPPYYIAAAQSLHAEYFNNLNKQRSSQLDIDINGLHIPSPNYSMNNYGGRLSDTVPLKSSAGRQQKPPSSDNYSMNNICGAFSETNPVPLKSADRQRDKPPSELDIDISGRYIPSENYSMNNMCAPLSDCDTVSLKSTDRQCEQPPTIIQDLLLGSTVGQHIVAPTPQRLHPLINDNDIVKPPSIQLLSSVNQEEPERSPSLQDRDLTSVNSDRSSLNSNETLTNNPQLQWHFGIHRNVSVKELHVRKINNDIGFRIADQFDMGIHVTEVFRNGGADGILKPGDRILAVDNIFFSNVNLEYANEVLQNCSSTITILVSRT